MFCCDLCALTPLVLMLKNKIYSLQSFLLQSEEELLGDRPSNLVTDTNPQKSKKIVGKIKLQGLFSSLFLLSITYC